MDEWLERIIIMKSTYKHLNVKDRGIIENCLNQGYKLCDIANTLNRDPRGIKEEIFNKRQVSSKSLKGNLCGKFESCKKLRLCDSCNTGVCKYCKHRNCNTFCKDFNQMSNCRLVNRYPYVCNGCDKLKTCRMSKVFYKAHIAQELYETNISEHKKGIKKTNKEIEDLDFYIKQGIKNGQSLSVIIANNSLNIAPSTAYRYISDKVLTVRNIDLKRKVRYKVSNKPTVKRTRKDYNYSKGRKFEDYGAYIKDNHNCNIWQMDTIIGLRQEEACVLSLLYTRSNLQLFFKLNSKTTDEVTRIFDSIKSHLSDDLFKETFEVILTDNGSEFYDPENIEISNETGEKLISVFYCDPNRSDQKGKCEKNHEHFRELIPKGRSLEPYDNKDIDYVSLMVNNYSRSMFKFKTPFEVSKIFLNEKVFELNNLREIPTSKVILKPLFKK